MSMLLWPDSRRSSLKDQCRSRSAETFRFHSSGPVVDRKTSVPDLWTPLVGALVNLLLVLYFAGVLLRVQYLRNKRKKSRISVPGKVEGAISESWLWIRVEEKEGGVMSHPMPHLAYSVYVDYAIG